MAGAPSSCSIFLCPVTWLARGVSPAIEACSWALESHVSGFHVSGLWRLPPPGLFGWDEPAGGRPRSPLEALKGLPLRPAIASILRPAKEAAQRHSGPPRLLR